MLTYEELFEALRKEKYSEKLQQLPKDFIPNYSEYVETKKKQVALKDGDMFSEDVLREKKQAENAVALFRDLMLRRKKKILDLVFVAAETGVMKKDFVDMLKFEKELFENLVGVVDSGDKALNSLMNGKDAKEDEAPHKMVLLNEDVEEFVDMNGNAVGPFKKGNLANLDVGVADVLIGSGQARIVDE